MTQEVLKLALEALERSVATCFDQYAHQQVMSQPDHFINQAITAVKEALREHAMREVQRLGQEIEQEPVAKYSDIVSDGGLDPRNKFDTTPPQRTWVGLTEQDLDYLCNLAYTGDEEFALAVQAKLMEKNA